MRHLNTRARGNKRSVWIFIVLFLAVYTLLLLLFFRSIVGGKSSNTSNDKRAPPTHKKEWEISKVYENYSPRSYSSRLSVSQYLGQDYRGKICSVVLESFRPSDDDIVDENPPPEDVPASQRSLFTYNEHLKIIPWYFDNKGQKLYKTWNKQQIDNWITKARNNERGLHYGATNDYLFKALDKYKDFVSHKQVLIVGSLEPWYEACALSRNAGHVTTLEYHDLEWDHPKISTFTVDEFSTFTEDEWGRIDSHRQFDSSISISSIEHTGLGRYGDPLNPFGDLSVMLHLKCLIKPGGLLFLNVPVSTAEGFSDSIIWNAHKMYGPKMLSALFDGWEVLDVFGEGYKEKTKWDSNYGGPVFVLRNVDFSLNDYFRMELFQKSLKKVNTI